MITIERGKSLFEKKEYNNAIRAFTAFLRENTDHADALYGRAISYRKINEFDKSIADLTIILQKLPDEPTLLCERGISYFHKKDIAAALKDMNSAIELDPNNPYRYSSRAYIRAYTDTEGAINDYKKAIDLDPKDEIALNNLGLLEEQAGRTKEAKSHFAKSNKIIGYNPEERNKTIETPSSFLQTLSSLFKSKRARQDYFIFIKSFFK